MTLQLGANFTVVSKVEATYNTAPGATGATQMRVIDSPGMALKMAEIKSAERRGDLLDTMARMGSRSAVGSFSSEAIVGAHDVWYEAAMRATWVPVVTITQATAGLTSIATPTTSTIVATAGSWITAGVRVGDVIRMTLFNTAANNNINLRIKSVSALTLTVHGTPLTVDAAADTTFSITIAKKLSHPTTPVRRTFYNVIRDVDIGAEVRFGGTRYLGFKMTGAPDGMALVEFPVLGGGMPTAVTGAAYYTTPTLPTGSPLTFADAVISLGGTDVVNLTAFSIDYAIAGSTLPILGAPNSPDVFDGKATLSGSISGARSDLAKLADYFAETERELHILLSEPESEPKDFIALYVPRLKLTGVDTTLGGDGAKIETLPWTSGVKEGAAATGYDATMFTLSTSAP